MLRRDADHRSTLRADDGIRTRDPHLGKVMRYQLRYVRINSEGNLTEQGAHGPNRDGRRPRGTR
jgi:hypothetical protein